MSVLAQGGRWESIHLYHSGHVYGRESDRAILDLAVPLARALIEEGSAQRYFFVRYGDGNSHVRLRLQGADGAVRKAIESELPAWVTSSGIEADIGPVELRWVRYVPETERYGGPLGLAVAERLFHASSEVAAALLCSPQARERPARWGSGVLTTVVLVSGMLRDARLSVAFLRRYGRHFLHAFIGDGGVADVWSGFDGAFERQAGSLTWFVDETWRRLKAGDPLSPALDAYRETVAAARRELRKVLVRGELRGPRGRMHDWSSAMDLLLPSYVHMTHNRLGVPTREEPYLAHLLVRALERVQGPRAPRVTS